MGVQLLLSKNVILKIWMHLLDSLFSADLLTLQISNAVRWWFFSCSCASLSCAWWWCSLCGGFRYCKINVDSFGWFWYFQALLSSAINGSLAEIWSLNSPDVFVTATSFSNQRVSMVHEASNLHESSTTLLEEGSAQLPSSGEFSGSGSAVFLEELDREWELDQTRSALRDSRLRSEDENREGLSSTFYFESEREAGHHRRAREPGISVMGDLVSWVWALALALVKEGQWALRAMIFPYSSQFLNSLSESQTRAQVKLTRDVKTTCGESKTWLLV